MNARAPDAVLAAAPALLGWARIWSPLVADADREAAWAGLGLPGCFDAVAAEYWSTFHAGMPQPPLPLLLHTAVGRDGAAVREDVMRVLQHLGLAWSDHVLPADHLGPVCEVLAVAVSRDDTVLVRELVARYLGPWCAFARASLAPRGSPLGGLVDRFEALLAATLA